jgi:flagellar basal body-associated protein FliL
MQSQPPQTQAAYGQVVPGQAPRKRRRPLRTLAIIVGIIVLLIIAGVVALFVTVNNSPAKAVSQQYYDAIKGQNYTTAFSFLDPTMTLTIQGQQQKINQQSFTQVAQAYDAQKGKVTAYSITSISVSSSNTAGNTASITVHVTRNSSYDVHLVLQQQGNTWKIVSFDSL